MAAQYAAIPSAVFAVLSLVVYFYCFWNVGPVEREPASPDAPDEEKLQNALEGFRTAMDLDRNSEKRKALRAYGLFLEEFEKLELSNISKIPDQVLVSLERLSVLCMEIRDYDMSLRFAQARKFVLEHALAGTTESTKPGIIQHAEMLRRMSQIMLQEKEFEMATDYANQAVKMDEVGSGLGLREWPEQKKKNLEAFVEAYAAMGRENYARNLEDYRTARAQLDEDGVEPDSDDGEEQREGTKEEGDESEEEGEVVPRFARMMNERRAAQEEEAD